MRCSEARVALTECGADRHCPLVASLPFDPHPRHPVSFFSELKERRLVQIVATYAAAGWVLLEGIGSLIERGVLPEIVYGVALVWYLGGLAVSVITGWYHGEKGHQNTTPVELGMLAVVGVTVLFFSWQQVSGAVADARLAEARESGVPLTRVAVRYFENLGSDDTAYLGDALTEALIDQLRGVSALDVTSAEAVLPFRGGNVPSDSVARALGVGTVIDGTVEAVGDRVRVNIRLVDGATGIDLDRTSIERPADELLSATRDVAEEVSTLFREQLGEEVRLRTVSEGTDVIEAWRALQQAERLRKDLRALPEGSGDQALELAQRADALLEEAAALDPSWSEARRLRGELAIDFAQVTLDPALRAGWVARGLEQVQTVLDDGPRSPAEEAATLEVRGNLRLIAYLARLAHDVREHEAFLAGAQADLERAVELDRGAASAYASLSVLRYQPGVGDLLGAATAARSAYEADPYLRIADDILDRLFWTNLDLGQFTQAREWCARGGERFPEDPRFEVCKLWMMTIPRAEPDLDAGWASQAALVDMVGPEARDLEAIRGRMLMAAAIARASEAVTTDEARRTMLADSARSVLETAHDDYVMLDDANRELFSLEAFAWVVLDEFDLAIDRWKAYAALNHGFQDSGDISWRWRELRDHPRFGEIVTQDAGH